jgi:transcriptional regulator with XRE-family HTH domain
MIFQSSVTEKRDVAQTLHRGQDAGMKERPSATDNSSLGVKIRKNRQRLGMSQVKLGRTLGTTHSAVSYWESGNAIPRTSLLRRMASIFDLPLSALIDAPEEEQSIDALLLELPEPTRETLITSFRLLIDAVRNSGEPLTPNGGSD